MQEKHGGSVAAMTVAQPGAKPCLKDSLSCGKLEDGVEIVSAPLPALVVFLPDVNSPRIPTLRQVLGAAKNRLECHLTGPWQHPEPTTPDYGRGCSHLWNGGGSNFRPTPMGYAKL